MCWISAIRSSDALSPASVTATSPGTSLSSQEVVSREEVAATAERTRLFGFEVDLLVEAPGGARPGSLPPLYAEDDAWLSEHRDAPAAALLERSTLGS